MKINIDKDNEQLDGRMQRMRCAKEEMEDAIDYYTTCCIAVEQIKDKIRRKGNKK